MDDKIKIAIMESFNRLLECQLKSSGDFNTRDELMKLKKLAAEFAYNLDLAMYYLDVAMYHIDTEE